MKAETRTVKGIFHGERRFEVPVYQRPYVWNRERQWEALWHDIEATAIRLAEARIAGHGKGIDAAVADKLAAPHFLGALVIEDQPVMTGAVDTRLVVDGQQRLTTLQLLLRGVLDALDAVNAPKPLRAQVRKAIRNDEEVVGEDELLKLAPRHAERQQFAAAMDPVIPAPTASRFADARAYFRDDAAEFLADADVPADPYFDGDAVAARASLLVATLLGLVKLVVIDLEGVDDAQVIFEALNARNTPLSATDLVKNLLFMRAQAQQHDPQVLYDTLWKRFDDESDWWLELVGVGHAQRARQDWLLGDWLIAQRGMTINVGRLYGEFRTWLDTSGVEPFEALSTLNQYADAYEVLNGRREGASLPEQQAFLRIEQLNITVATPVILWLLVQPAARLEPDERERAILAIESFVMRRMAVKWQTRAYGPMFVEVLKAAQAAETNPGQAVVDALRAQPHGYSWPSDADIVTAFEEGRYYGNGGINRERLRMVLGAIDRRLQQQALKSEPSIVDYDGLQIEHVIPQNWRTHWPVTVQEPGERLIAEQERDRHVNRIGNLTLATKHLNPSMSNDPWAEKRAELQKHSVLQLNAALVAEPEWDEQRVRARGAWLAGHFGSIWRGPDDAIWEGATPIPKGVGDHGPA
ncbi:DUF262 domain-containing protein [Solirubrobacter sp. CPCC 204708]|uniref:DUF262 domain-containing HNH endonuclease family protein n=1 Tax=Solirubrobacter deserti TaxID=2282478 RepID=A0ABT4RLJ3_9ACTN|nr:DUF262 domain-containing protein [Solirubrobacter deserti]MBE2316681.1 DUF262 domain-containing protein [Solirubrobacter deserti]MDA0139437.1 DUF262 domain-containing HNH endonuclease family protein [Solirubrobacter deserti]